MDLDIIIEMARGWESKSVEAQQAEAADNKKESRTRLTAEQAAQIRRREGLQLSRRRVLQQLEAAADPRRRDMLTAALAELDKQIHILESE
jgi:DNA-binding ferritin-like protein